MRVALDDKPPFPLSGRVVSREYDAAAAAPHDPIEKWRNQCGGLPETSSAFGPMHGRRTWFEGTAKGADATVFSYRLQFNEAATVPSITLVGTNWAGSTLQLLDEKRAVVAKKLLTE